jgi:hypothetical protein
MVNYQNGKIYRLVGGGLEYYGSTCSDLRHRLWNHKNICNIKNKKYSSYKLFETGDKVEIVLVEYFPCENKMELTARERWYIENNECVNKSLPNMTRKETTKRYYDSIKDTKRKEWYDNNKDKIKEKKSEIIKCECGAEICKGEISRHKKTKKHINHLGFS